MGGKAAARKESGSQHRHWDKVVSAAYLRMMGQTQAEAAASVGRSERTIWGWENDPELWSAARAEAEDRWMADTIDRARQTVHKAAGRIPDLAFKLLERTDARLAPPKQQHEHAGEGGGPIEVTVTRRIIRPDGDD
jgi:hypothetical protein